MIINHHSRERGRGVLSSEDTFIGKCEKAPSPALAPSCLPAQPQPSIASAKEDHEQDWSRSLLRSEAIQCTGWLLSCTEPETKREAVGDPGEGNALKHQP